MGEWSYNFILPSPSYLRSSFEGLIRMRCQQLLLVRAVVLSWILPCSLLPIRSSPSKESRKKKVSIYSKWYFLYFSIFGGGAVSYVWILPKLPIFLKMVRTTVSVEGSTFLSLISRSVGIVPVVPSSSVIPPHAPSSSTTANCLHLSWVLWSLMARGLRVLPHSCEEHCLVHTGHLAPDFSWLSPCLPPQHLAPQPASAR